MILQYCYAIAAAIGIFNVGKWASKIASRSLDAWLARRYEKMNIPSRDSISRLFCRCATLEHELKQLERNIIKDIARLEKQ